MICDICKEYYNKGCRIPKLLPCGHTYCLSCIPLLFSEALIHCPQDGQSFSLTLEELSTSNSILDLMDRPDGAMICCNKHKMKPLASGEAAQCDICRKKSKLYLECPLCVYIICNICEIWLSSSEPIHFSQLLCGNGHELRMTHYIEEFYKSIRKTRPEKFLCDGCLCKKKGGSAHCRQCKIDYCCECVAKYQRLSESFEGVVCGKKIRNSGLAGWISAKTVCKQNLTWRYDIMKFKCSKCRNKFNKSGGYVCSECKKEYCIVCAFNKLKI